MVHVLLKEYWCVRNINCNREPKFTSIFITIAVPPKMGLSFVKVHKSEFEDNSPLRLQTLFLVCQIVICLSICFPTGLHIHLTSYSSLQLVTRVFLLKPLFLCLIIIALCRAISRILHNKPQALAFLFLSWSSLSLPSRISRNMDVNRYTLYHFMDVDSTLNGRFLRLLKEIQE